jgi:hypothetical protein
MTTPSVSYTITAEDQFNKYNIVCNAYRDCARENIKGNCVVHSVSKSTPTITFDRYLEFCSNNTLGFELSGKVALIVSWPDVCKPPVLTSQGSTLVQPIRYSRARYSMISCPSDSATNCPGYSMYASTCLQEPPQPPQPPAPQPPAPPAPQLQLRRIDWVLIIIFAILFVLFLISLVWLVSRK